MLRIPWLMAKVGTGGEVKFPAWNERAQVQNEHRFRLRHQHLFTGEPS